MVCTHAKANAHILAYEAVELPKYVFHTNSFLILKVALSKMLFESSHVKISASLSLIQAVGDHSHRRNGVFILDIYIYI